MSSQIKNIIIAIVLIVLAFGGYYYFKKINLEVGTGLEIDAQKDVDILGQDIIRVLNRINTIDLDRSIFTDPVYQELQDRSQKITDQPVGRENIFLPYQRSAVNVGTTTATN